MTHRLTIIKGGAKTTRSEKSRDVDLRYRGAGLTIPRVDAADLLRTWRASRHAFPMPRRVAAWRTSPALTPVLDYMLRAKIEDVSRGRRFQRDAKKAFGGQL